MFFKRVTLMTNEEFIEFITPYEQMIYGIAYRYVRNKEDAKDVAQESVVKMYRDLAGGKPEAGKACRAWVAKVTVNTAIDELRKRRNRPAVSLDMAQPLDKGMGPLETAVANESLENIFTAINKLPEEYKRIIILRDVEGLSYDELTEALDAKPGTVKSRLSRARAMLAKYYEIGMEQKQAANV